MDAYRLPLMVYDHDGGYFHRHEHGPKKWKSLLEFELRSMNPIEENILPSLVHTQPTSFGYVVTVGERFRSTDGRSALRIFSTCWPNSYPPLKRLDALVQLLRSQSFELTAESNDHFGLPCFNFIDSNDSDDFVIEREHGLAMSGIEFTRLEKIRTTGPSDVQVCRIWALSPPDVRLNTELLIGYGEHESNHSHRVWGHEIQDILQSPIEQPNPITVNAFSEYRDSLFTLLSDVDRFGELDSKWWKNLCLCLDEAGVPSTLDLNSLIRLNLYHAARAPASEDSQRYRSAALRKLSVGLRLSQDNLLDVFLNNSPEIYCPEVEDFDPEHRLIILNALFDRHSDDKLNVLQKYSSVLDTTQINYLISLIDLAELQSIEKSTMAVQHLRQLNIAFLHSLLQNQLNSKDPNCIHTLLTHLSSKRASPVLQIDSSLLGVLSKFEATEQHVLVNPDVFSNLVLSSHEQNTEAFQQQLTHAQYSLLMNGELKGISMVESMVVRTPRALMNKHHSSKKSVMMWLDLMHQRMTEPQRSFYAVQLADLHKDYSANKFFQWIFDKGSNSQLRHYCKRYYGTDEYSKMIATIDDSFFKKRLSMKSKFGFALPLSGSKKSVQKINHRHILTESFRFTMLKTVRERLSFGIALSIILLFAVFPVLTYFEYIHLFGTLQIPSLGSFSQVQESLWFLLGNITVLGGLIIRRLRRRNHWKRRLKEVLS